MESDIQEKKSSWRRWNFQTTGMFDQPQPTKISGLTQKTVDELW